MTKKQEFVSLANALIAVAGIGCLLLFSQAIHGLARLKKYILSKAKAYIVLK